MIFVVLYVQSRWSFDESAPTELENRLVQREAPSFAILRCVFLAIVTWLLVFSAIIGSLVVIFVVGRFASHAIIRALPAWLPVGSHDPLCLFIGLRETAVFLDLVVRTAHEWPRIRTVFRVIPSTVYRKIFTFSLTVFFVFPFAVGLCCRKICRPDTQDEDASPVLSFMYDLAAGQVICTILGLVFTQNRVIAFLDQTLGTKLNDFIVSTKARLNALILSATDVVESHNSYDHHAAISPPRMLFCEPLSQAEIDVKLAVQEFEGQYLFPATIYLLKAILMSALGDIISWMPGVISLGGPFKKLIEMVIEFCLFCLSCHPDPSISLTIIFDCITIILRIFCLSSCARATYWSMPGWLSWAPSRRGCLDSGPLFGTSCMSWERSLKTTTDRCSSS